jgi:hypothetical protein
MLKNSAPRILSTLNINPTKDPKINENKSKQQRLTTSESQRNIGSVTFFLDAKSFEENIKMRTFQTNELWLPVRDITVAPNSKLSVSFNLKHSFMIIYDINI